MSTDNYFTKLAQKIPYREACDWYRSHGGLGSLPPGNYYLVEGRQHLPSTGNYFLVAEGHGLTGLWSLTS